MLGYRALSPPLALRIMCRRLIFSTFLLVLDYDDWTTVSCLIFLSVLHARHFVSELYHGVGIGVGLLTLYVCVFAVIFLFFSFLIFASLRWSSVVCILFCSTYPCLTADHRIRFDALLNTSVLYRGCNTQNTQALIDAMSPYRPRSVPLLLDHEHDQQTRLPKHIRSSSFGAFTYVAVSDNIPGFKTSAGTLSLFLPFTCYALIDMVTWW